LELSLEKHLKTRLPRFTMICPWIALTPLLLANVVLKKGLKSPVKQSSIYKWQKNHAHHIR